MAYKVKTAFKERNENMKLYEKNDFYTYGEQKRIDFLVKEGYLVEVKDSEVEKELNHVGDGYYELPNGEKVKGKEEALKALSESGE